MSTTKTIEGGIYLNLDYGVKPYETSQFSFFAGSLDDFQNHKALTAHTISFELPDGFDPRADQLARLKEQKQKLHAEFAAAVTEIDARINKLLAISNDAEVTQ